MGKDVKDYAEWVYTMIASSIDRRKAWVKDIFNNLRRGVGFKNSSKGALEFTDMLNDRSEFDLIGFSANLHYVKHEKRPGDTEEDLNCVFVHPWATPKLLYKHKTLPLILITGDDLRLDESVLDEDSKNMKQNVRGFTG